MTTSKQVQINTQGLTQKQIDLVKALLDPVAAAKEQAAMQLKMDYARCKAGMYA